jgi:hypothetical protein
MKVVCYMYEGYSKAYAVPNDATEDLYEYGVFLGPPDLRVLGLPEETLKKLLVDLVNAGLYTAPLFMGERQTVLKICTKHGLNSTVLRNMLSIFQQEYYGE